MEEDESIWYVCNICKERNTFKVKSQLLEHKKSVHREKLREIIRRKREYSTNLDETGVDDKRHKTMTELLETQVPSTTRIHISNTCMQNDETLLPENENEKNLDFDNPITTSSLSLQEVSSSSDHHPLVDQSLVPDLLPQDVSTTEAEQTNTISLNYETEMDKHFEDYSYCQKCLLKFVNIENFKAHSGLCQNSTRTNDMKPDLKPTIKPVPKEEDSIIIKIIPINLTPSTVFKYLWIREPRTTRDEYIPLPSKKKRNIVHQPEKQASVKIDIPIQNKVSSLPVKKYPKPPLSYNNCTVLALENSKNGLLTVHSIYKFLLTHFPFFKQFSDTYVRNSLNYSIGTSKHFKKFGKVFSSTFKGQQRKVGTHLWGLNLTHSEAMRQIVKTKMMDFKVEIQAAMADPETFPSIMDGQLSRDWDDEILTNSVEIDQKTVSQEVNRIQPNKVYPSKSHNNNNKVPHVNNQISSTVKSTPTIIPMKKYPCPDVMMIPSKTVAFTPPPPHNLTQVTKQAQIILPLARLIPMSSNFSGGIPTITYTTIPRPKYILPALTIKPVQVSSTTTTTTTKVIPPRGGILDPVNTVTIPLTSFVPARNIVPTLQIVQDKQQQQADDSTVMNFKLQTNSSVGGGDSSVLTGSITYYG